MDAIQLARHREYQRAWRAANPERVQKYGATRKSDPSKCEIDRLWRIANRDQLRAGQKARRAKNPEKIRAASRAWYRAHTEQKLEENRAWKLANPDKVRAEGRAWTAANLEKFAAKNARRYAAKRQHTPEWADQAKIKEFYAHARVMTETFGVPYHVDHIIPLRGKKASGLHVHTNLQILPGAENVRKGNRYIPS